MSNEGRLIRLNLGCRNTLLPGYYNIDQDDLSLANAGDHLRFLQMDVMDLDKHFLASSVDEVYARHLLEHLNVFQVTQVLYKIWGVLRPAGKLVGIVPDMERMILSYRRKLERGDLRDIDILPLELFGEPEGGTLQQHKTVWFEEMARYFLTRQGLFTIQEMTLCPISEGTLEIPYELRFVAHANKPDSSIEVGK